MTPDAALLVLAGILGLAIGSFLNVVVHRVPEGRSVTRPRSACPACGTAIAARDNIPVLSWVLLRGRCRSCAAAISARYPAVEAGTAALFVGVTARYGPGWTAAVLAAFGAGALALALVDLDRMLLPRRILYPTAATCAAILIAAAATTGAWSRLGTAAACAAAAFAVFFLLNLVNPRWLGFGDVRLAGLIGLVLGWLGPAEVIVGLLVANLVGLVVAGGGMATGRLDRRSRLPYGVFLAGGSIVSALAGAPLAALLAARPPL